MIDPIQQQKQQDVRIELHDDLAIKRLNHVAKKSLMLDVEGTTLTAEDELLLTNPKVSGLILFTKNYQHKTQLKQLIQDARSLRPTLLIAVDHEGGRVQRFKESFTAIPAMQHLGQLYDEDPKRAIHLAKEMGYILASELRECDIDMSFTPVLDLDFGTSEVMASRSFHRRREVVTELAMALSQGLKQAGMPNCGKHFPGHGHVVADTHHHKAVDERDLNIIMQEDLYPYQQLIAHNYLDAVMMAHVVYPKICNDAAGFSKTWCQTILREQLKFKGIIFSDDLTMRGVEGYGYLNKRAEAAFTAGVDVSIVCHDRNGVKSLLTNKGEIFA